MTSMKKFLTTLFTVAFLATSVYPANIILEWQKPADVTDVMGYRVYYLRNTNDVFAPTTVNMVLATVVTNQAITNVVIPNLSSGVIRFRITAYNGHPTNKLTSVESDYSNEVGTNVLNVPSVPQLLKITGVN